ncbi:MAG: hypothetical protein M1820_008888 [Bogoriella megaspora]|nr:MAG: hypothetical protein M1820_008888 [Bogoriella megaspora]
MSLVPTLHHELASPTNSSSSRSSNRQDAITSEIPRVPSITVSTPQVEANIDNVEAGSPPAERRVFDIAPLNVMGKSRKLTITALIIGSNLVQMISNFTTIGGGLALARQLGVSDPSKANWIAASYPLTQGTFVLISGRLGSIYSHKTMLLLGGAWFTIWSLVTSFCRSYLLFNIARGFTGIGGAFILPNAVAMLAITTPPGRMRNLSLGFFSASAPVGGWAGALLAGVFLRLNDGARAMFWCLAGLGVVVFGLLAWLLPKEKPVDPNGKIDYVGGALGTSALILFNFVWNQAPAVGWATPYEIGLLITSIALIGCFVVWEKKFAKEPIMPLDIFQTRSFSTLVLVTLLSYMSVGTSLWYMVEWQQNLRGWSVLHFAVGWIPFGICAVLAGFVAAWLIPRLGARWIVALGAGSILLANLLLATMPVQQNYWPQMFPATVLSAFCPDLVYTAAQIIASNSVRRHQQGIAGSLIGTLNLYGNSLGLGFAGTVEVETSKHGQHIATGYRSALWFGVGIAAVSLVLDIAFVRTPRDDREGWADDRDRDTVDDGVAMVSGSTTELELRRVTSRNS